MQVFEQLKQVVGPDGYLEGDAVGPRYSQDLWGGDPRGVAPLVLRPTTTAQVSEVLRLCHAARQPVVPQGGMTGLVSGGVPDFDEVVLSTERMTRIEELDRANRTMTVQAGVPLQAVHEHAEQHGLIFPLDLAARGSCTIGGCLSTNAGGNRVLLYGMTRELVLGVEAVLADGTVVDGLHKLPKNNAGYDLKHLFIGTEGTLGIVTRAVLRLRPRPASELAAFCALRSFDDALALLHRLQARLPGLLSAFEAMWQGAYELAVGQVPTPFPAEHPIYVLAECRGSHPEEDAARFEAALESCADLLVEAVVGREGRKLRELWAVREAIPEAALRLRPLFGFDLSLPVGDVEPCLEALTRELRERWPAVRLVVFGHLGDGNIHVAVITGEKTKQSKHVVEEIVYRNVGRYAGSISAEHGIGFEKRPFLHLCRKPEELALMRLLKRTLDPANVLNPGRIFVLEGAASPPAAGGTRP